MINTILFGIGIFFVIAYAYGYLSNQEYKSNTILRTIVHWIMALGFFLVHDVPAIHLLYTFPLGIGLAFAGIKFYPRTNPMTILVVSAIIWSFVLMGLSDYFGTFA